MFLKLQSFIPKKNKYLNTLEKYVYENVQIINWYHFYTHVKFWWKDDNIILVVKI